MSEARAGGNRQAANRGPGGLIGRSERRHEACKALASDIRDNDAKARGAGYATPLPAIPCA